MKKYITLFALAVLPVLGYSQSIFDKYEEMDHVAAISINKGLIDLVSAVDIDGDEDAKEFVEMAKGLNGIKVFVTEDKRVSADMATSVKKHLRNAKLEELMRIKDRDTNVKFYVKEGRDDNHVAELLMFVSGFEHTDIDINGRKLETVLVTVTGDIDLRKIATLTEKMNLPDELNKAGER